MPELPEVETVCRTLRRHVLGQEIGELAVLQPSLRWPVDVAGVKAVCEGGRIQAVRRRAKYILIDVHRAARKTQGVLAIHLGMSGILRVTPTHQPARLHDHAIWRLTGAARDVRFNDPRRFGSLHGFWADEELGHRLFAHLGVEPLDASAFTADYLYERTRGVSRAVKHVIMDAACVVGVGNIYASEALWRSGISPGMAAGRLSRPRLARLVAAIVTTLQDAIEQGGTTLRDFSDADAATGHFAQRLQVYGREGLACYRCGAPVKRFVQGARSTFCCYGCQKSS